MCDMIFNYAKYDDRGKLLKFTLVKRNPERKQPYHQFFMRLESRLRKNGQFRLSLQVHIYL